MTISNAPIIASKPQVHLSRQERAIQKLKDPVFIIKHSLCLLLAGAMGMAYALFSDDGVASGDPWAYGALTFGVLESGLLAVKLGIKTVKIAITPEEEIVNNVPASQPTQKYAGSFSQKLHFLGRTLARNLPLIAALGTVGWFSQPLTALALDLMPESFFHHYYLHFVYHHIPILSQIDNLFAALVTTALGLPILGGLKALYNKFIKSKIFNRPSQGAYVTKFTQKLIKRLAVNDKKVILLGSCFGFLGATVHSIIASALYNHILSIFYPLAFSIWPVACSILVLGYSAIRRKILLLSYQKLFANPVFEAALCEQIQSLPSEQRQLLFKHLPVVEKMLAAKKQLLTQQDIPAAGVVPMQLEPLAVPPVPEPLPDKGGETIQALLMRPDDPEAMRKLAELLQRED